MTRVHVILLSYDPGELIHAVFIIYVVCTPFTALVFTHVTLSLAEKEAEAARTFAQLQDELRQVEAPSRPRNMQEKIRRKSSFFLIEFQPNEERENVKSNKRQIADLKLAFTEFYLSLVLIQNYQVQ